MPLRKIKKRYKKYSIFFIRVSIAALFLYYGIKALLSPEVQGMIWTATWARNIITSIMPLGTFMFIFGLLQTAVGAALFVGYRTKESALVASFLLLGIIVNLFQIDKALMLRDIVILTASLHLWIEGCGKYCVDNLIEN